jgi:hypothetical protein
MNSGLYGNGLRFLTACPTLSFPPEPICRAGRRAFGMTRGFREQGMGNKGGTAALVPHPSLLKIAVIPNVAPRNEESLNALLIRINRL